MAKGLRSKSKIATRNARRNNPKGDYAITAAARLHQVTTRLAETAKAAKISTQPPTRAGSEAASDAGADAAMDAQLEANADVAETEMDTDGTTKKISTSEPRNSRRESWRRAKGFKPKRVKGTTFGHSVGSKNNGKPSRRR